MCVLVCRLLNLCAFSMFCAHRNMQCFNASQLIHWARRYGFSCCCCKCQYGFSLWFWYLFYHFVFAIRIAGKLLLNSRIETKEHHQCDRQRHIYRNNMTNEQQQQQQNEKKWKRAKNNNKFNHNKVYKQIISYGIVRIKWLLDVWNWIQTWPHKAHQPSNQSANHWVLSISDVSLQQFQCTLQNYLDMNLDANRTHQFSASNEDFNWME